MKANAPEKIYMSPAGVLYKGDKQQSNDIEYVRKDAFIEKAINWLKEQNEMIGVSFQEDFLERFKNYMEK